MFGPLAIENGVHKLGPRDLGGTRPKQVFEILLAARGHHVPTDRLFDLLWSDDRPQNAAGSLQTFVSVLRSHLTNDRVLARELVVTEPEAYRIAADRVELDLDLFDELLERSAGQPTRAAGSSLRLALELVGGEVLEDEPYAAWAADLRNTYQGRVLGARLDLAHVALAERDYDDALAQARAAVTLDPFGERAHRTQMLALYALGRQHEALEVYRRFRTQLDEELGLEPTTATRTLEASILRQDDPGSLLPRPIAPESVAAGRRPLRLLGRGEELAALERGVRGSLDGSHALVLLDGEAGLGKTRLLEELATSLVGVRLGRGTCSPLEQHLPYVPLAAAVRDAIGPGGLAGLVQSPLRLILPELASDGPEPEVAELEALEALVELLCELAPIVLLVDDVHWADPATVAALSYLQRRCSRAGVALVAAMAGEHAPAGQPVRRLRPDVRVRLEPLTATELAPLGIPDLHEATGGNPRFVAEVVACGGEPTLTAALTETLLEQCRSEGAQAYRILVAASILEPSFDPEPLASLLGLEVAALVEELERLCERRILGVDGPRFRFRYALVRDVLSASLSPARERLLREQLDREHSDLAATVTNTAPRLEATGP
jgi:DNA-binding SARP family transcriptional activator